MQQVENAGTGDDADNEFADDRKDSDAAAERSDNFAGGQKDSDEQGGVPRSRSRGQTAIDSARRYSRDLRSPYGVAPYTQSGSLQRSASACLSREGERHQQSHGPIYRAGSRPTDRPLSCGCSGSRKRHGRHLPRPICATAALLRSKFPTLRWNPTRCSSTASNARTRSG